MSDPSALQRLRHDWFLLSVSMLLTTLLLVFGTVMFNVAAAEYVAQLLGLETKNPVLTFLGVGIGGLLFALQAAMSHKRARAMEHAARAQADAVRAQAEANVYVEHGQKQQRQKDALDHLASDSAPVRLAGAYELLSLADDNEGLRPRVMEILCAHILAITGEAEYRKVHASSPSSEVQNLLTLLFKVKEKEDYIFSGCHAELTGSWLNGAHLSDACLQWAALDGVSLRGAYLDCATLYGASLRKAKLQGADFTLAELSAAHLFKADLRGAVLGRAKLLVVEAQKAKLQGADLRLSHWEAADLSDAQLQGANAKEAHFQSAHFMRTAFHGVHGGGEGFDPDATIATRIRRRIGQETEVSEVTFSGGINEEDVDALADRLGVINGPRIRATLRPHAGKQRSNRPPKGAITGTYTKAEAEKWIREGQLDDGEEEPTE